MSQCLYDWCLENSQKNLLDEWHQTKNGILSPSDVSPKSNKKVWWLCENGHEWDAVISSRVTGCGCPYCSGRKIANGYNDLKTINPELASEWSYMKNSFSSPDSISPFSHKKVWWKCNRCGNEWQAEIKSRHYGSGCLCKAKEKQSRSYRLNRVEKVGSLFEKFPDLLSEWHPTKNGEISPRDISPGSNIKIWWKCNVCGHNWSATVSSRTLNNTGCTSCGYKQSANTRVKKQISEIGSLSETNPELAAEWHPIKNLKLNPTDILAGSNIKIWWKCCICGHDWEALVSSRNQGVGCPICGLSKSAENRIKGKIEIEGALSDNNPALAVQWHPIKNGGLLPSNVTVFSNKKVWWMCEKGHEWQAGINSRNSGNGCPVCANEKHSSFPEQAIFYYLNQLTVTENRSKIAGKEIDVLLPLLSIGVEYDGHYYHKGSKNQEREEMKNDVLLQNGVKLIRIKETEKEESDILNKVIYCHYDKSYAYLNEVIMRLISFVNTLSGDNFVLTPDIERDQSAIYEQYIFSEKENSLQHKYPEAVQIWDFESNGLLTPDKITYGSDKKVFWKCEYGHSWKEKISEVTVKGNRCPFCSGHRVCEDNCLATVNPKLVTEWNMERNKNLTPHDVLPNSNKKVWWKCEKGHEWQATIASRNTGAGCPYCKNRYVNLENCLAAVNIKLASEWHSTKNGEMTVFNVSPFSHKKAWWKCNSCGFEWYSQIKSRNSGFGCPECGKKTLGASQRKNRLIERGSLVDNNPTLATEWHPSKNVDLRPSDVLCGSNVKAWWKCNICGYEWQSLVSSRSKGVGCPECGKKKIGATKNNPLTPNDVLTGTNKKVWWKCSVCNFEWEADISSRAINGNGCPSCAKKKRNKIQKRIPE